MKKLGRKVILAIVTTLLLVVTMTTSTFAWISLIDQVEAKGMKFKVETPASLYISTTGTDGEFYDEIDFQSVAATKLYPASSVEGKAFFAAHNLKKITDLGRTTANNIDAIDSADKGAGKYNELYEDGTTAETGALFDAQGYVEFKFYLKLVTTADEPSKTVYLQEATLTYNGNAANVADQKVNAFRYAIMCDEGKDPNAETSFGVGSFLQNFTAQAYKSPTVFDENDVATTAAELDDVQELEDKLFELTAAGEKVYTVIVRIWLDGEDAATYNKNFAELNKDYSLTLKFGFKEATSGLYTVE